MTCENINLLPPRVLLHREAVYYSSKVLVEPFLTAGPVCTQPAFHFGFRRLQSPCACRPTVSRALRQSAASKQLRSSVPSIVVSDLDSPSVLTGVRSITHMRGPSVLCYRQIHQAFFSGGPWAEFTFDRGSKRTTALLECRREFSTWQLVGGSWSDVIRCEWSHPSSKCAANSVRVNPALLKNASVTLTAETWTTIYSIMTLIYRRGGSFERCCHKKAAK